MSTPKTHTKRVYKRITPATVARHKTALIKLGNNTAAVRESDAEYRTPHDRGYRIQKKSESMNTVDFIDEQFQQIGVSAVNRVGQLVLSNDERIATKNSHYVIDHLRGKAVQRTESKHLSLNIQTVLD